MYWGNSDNHFQSFVAFVSGYQMARGKAFPLDKGYLRELDEMIPADFHVFVTNYYGHEFPYGGFGWTNFIEENSSSGTEALQLFFELRGLCLEERTKSEPTNGGGEISPGE